MAGRTRRSAEERVRALTEKINYHKKCIAALEEKREKILHPPAEEKAMKSLIKQAQERGLSLEDISSKLGLQAELEEN